MTAQSVLTDNQKRLTLDATKGVLILLIVLGHNHQLVNASPEGRWFLYNWHVYSFFLITALMPFRPEQPGFMRTRFVRYYVPFLIFFTLVWAVTEGWDRPGQKIGDWGMAAVIGSADLLGVASGARLYWFLPALLGLTILRWGISKFGEWKNYVLVTVAIVGFLISGLLSPTIKPYIPLGLPIALYALGPCLVFGKFTTFALDGSRVRLLFCAVVSAIVFSICNAIAAQTSSTLILAAFQYFDLRDPLALIVHALLAISACSTIVLLIALTARSKLLVWLGTSSLLIYLSHQIFYSLLLVLVRRTFPGALREYQSAMGVLLFLLTLLVSAGFAYCVTRSVRARRILTPRDFDDWLIGLGLKVRR